jgi:hypothetical protein
MGNGSGPGRLNSRVYTNSYSLVSSAMVKPFKYGGSFAGLSRPQYSYITYNTLAYQGAGAGGRAGRWARASGNRISFIPPYLVK